MKAAEIEDKAGLERWLNAVPEAVRREVALAIASRCALRVLPLAVQRTKPTSRRAIKLIFTAFWRTAIARSACNLLDRNIVAAAHFAATIASDARLNANSAAAFDAEHFSGILSGAAFSVSDAVGFGADAEAFANIAASAAADAAEHDDGMWKAIRSDARIIEKERFVTGTGHDLIQRPLWRNVPLWFDETLSGLHVWLNNRFDARDSRQIWWDWYQPIIEGNPAFGLKDSKAAESIERAIAVGDRDEQFNLDFWVREPREINVEIAQWVAEARAAESAQHKPTPVFLSYTDLDLEPARRIGSVVAGGGYDLFAQYLNMPPGSNFVAEMQKGLARMGRFVPVYSPDYVGSLHCQAEWNAAYHMDPLGERRLIVGFMLRKTELPPLHAQTVYVSLMGLREEQARDVILDALRRAGAPMSAEETRRVAAQKAVPLADLDEGGRLTYVHAPDVQQPFIDDDVTRLPVAMREQSEMLFELAEGSNSPQGARLPLRKIAEEFRVHGPMARVPDLQRYINMLSAEQRKAVADGSPWIEGAMGTGLDDMHAMFSRFRQNFPLVTARDIDVKQSSIEATTFDAMGFQQSHLAYAKMARKAARVGIATDEFSRVSQDREDQRKTIEDLARYVPSKNDRFVQNEDEKSVDELKRGYVFDQSGTVDRMLDRVEKVTSIADTEVGKALISAAKAVLQSIWG